MKRILFVLLALFVGTFCAGRAIEASKRESKIKRRTETLIAYYKSKQPRTKVEITRDWIAEAVSLALAPIERMARQ